LPNVNGAMGLLSVGVTVDVSAFNTGMDQIESRAQKTTSSLNSMSSAITQGFGTGLGIAAAVAGITSIENAVSGAIGAVVGLSSELEKARIGFTAFTGSVEKSNDFIKQLQDFAQSTTFEFPSLLQASKQLMGMGIQAEQVIPLLKDVATAVMAVGGGDVEIRRVNLALTQMIAAGKVNAQDMNQLAQAGVPAWKMLADSMGKSIGEVRQMSKEGQISAAQMIKALDDAAHKGNLADILAKSSETWQAATSNIVDGLRNIATAGFDPLFQVMRNFAVELSKSLSMENTAQFTADLKATVQDIVNLAAPLGAAFQRAFEAFKTDGIKGALNSVLTDVQTLAQNMFGAGVNVVEQFAGGLLSGAGSAIQSAANFIAQTIADYLIGNSPPPVGPLKDIATGGAAVIQAWVDGMKTGVDASGIQEIAQQVTDALGNVSKSLTLDDANAALKSVGDNLEGLASLGNDAEGAIRTLNGAIRDNQSSVRDLQNSATDVTDAYNAAIDPLQKQVDLLKDATDLATKQADIQDRIALAQLKGQLAQAQGDPVKRAQLQSQLDVLDQQEKELALQERSVSLSKQAADIQTRAQADALKNAAAEAKAKGNDEKAKQLAEQARQLTTRDTQENQNLNALAQRRLQLQQQQNTIQQQMSGMVDKEAVARIKAQQAQVTAVKDQRDLNSEVNNLQRDLQAAPLEQQIKDLKAQEQALLDPIKARIEALQREGQSLTEQRQQWTQIKQNITDVTQAIKAQQKAAEDASKKAALAHPTDLAGIVTPEAITHVAELTGKSWLAGFTNWIKTNGPQLIGGAIGAIVGGNLFGPLGAIAGAKFGSDFVTSMQTRFGSLEEIGGKIAGKISDALNIDTGGANNSMEAFAIIFETVRDRAIAALTDMKDKTLATLEDLRSGVAQKLQDMQGTLSDWQKSWQETFGQDTPGAQAGINAIDGLSKMLQSLQLLLSGDFKAALDTAKVGLGEFGTAATDAGTAVSDAFTKIQTTVSPITEEIKSQWNSVVDAVNSAEFKDNVSIIFQNISTVLQMVQSDLDKTHIAFENISNTAPDGKKYIDFGAAIQSVAHDIAALSTAFVNLLDLFNTVDQRSQLSIANLDDMGKATILLAKAIGQAVMGDWEGAQQTYNQEGALERNMQQRTDAAAKLWEDLLARMKQRSADLNKAGQDLGTAAVDGITDSITKGEPDVTSTGNDLGTAVITGAQQALDAHSPSAAMAALGTDATQGLSDGIVTGTPIVLASVDAMTAGMLLQFQTGWAAIVDDSNTEWALLLVTMDEGGVTVVDSVTQTMQAILQVSQAGWSAVHASMTGQLDEIYALITQKGVDIVGAITNMMASILTVIESEASKWAAAGTALGNAFAQAATSSMSNVSSSGGLTMMSNGAGGKPLQSVDTSSSQTALKSWVGALVDAERKTGIPARTLWGIIMAENGGGQSSLSRDSNNYFSISAVPGRANQSGTAPGGRFASYATPQASLDDFLSLITESPSYANAYANKGDVDKFINALVEAHYIVPEAGFPVDTWIRNVKSGAANFDNMLPQVSSQLMSNNISASGGVSGMQLGVSQFQAGAQAGLSNAAAAAACGPYAAVLFSQAVGRNPTLAEATQLASKVGWTPERGMAGTGSEMALLSNMGLNAVQQQATPENIDAALRAGHPIALSTPKHYFVGQGGTAAGGINVGATGTVMGGAATMTLDQINALGGGTSQLIVLLGTLDKQGTMAFTDVGHAAQSQMGPPLADASASVIQFTNDTVAAGTQISASNAGLVDSTTTLSDSISAGLVPAGLAAVGAVGQMSIGIQPLIAQFANGQITSDQLGQSIVGLASSSGLATQPLAQLAAGNASVDEALRQVLTALAQADPAFAQIQQQFDQTQHSSGELANVLGQGLANVTGQVGPAFAQMAQGIQPLEQAFANGQVSADQFVQGVVELAASSGLTQQPLRMMQDGLLTSNQALAAVVQQVASADPAIASMGLSIGDAATPATDAATAFLTWVDSLAKTSEATDTANQAIATLPQSVTDVQAPIEDAASNTMQVIPDQAQSALDTTIKNIQDSAPKAADAATEVGKAIVDALTKTVEDGAGQIADAAMKVVEDALKAAKKAADEATKGLDSKGKNKGDDGTDSKATGGQLRIGNWTLVGEDGPELISPNGYVYTARETMQMIEQNANMGLRGLQKRASGGKTSSKSTKSSSKSKSGSSSGSKSKQEDPTPKAPEKQQTPESGPELDLQQKILEVTLQRDKLLVQMQPLTEAIRKEEAAMQAAQKGSVADQLTIIANKKATAEIDSKIYHLEYDSDAMHTSTHDIELAIRDTKLQQEQASKGDLNTQIKLDGLSKQSLIYQQQIAQIAVDSLPLRQRAADMQDKINDALKGTFDQQIHINHLQIEKDKNALAENALQQQSFSLRKAVADQEKVVSDLQKGSLADQQKLADIAMQRAVLSQKQAAEQAAMVPIQHQINTLQAAINEELKGDASQRAIIAANAKATKDIDLDELKNTTALLPVQNQIRITQEAIDKIQKGSVADQQASIDLQTKQAQLQLQEISVQGQLRDVNAGTLNLSQEQINALQKQLEVIDNQKAQLDDQTQVKQLQAQISSADSEKQLVALQAQSDIMTQNNEDLDYQKAVIQNQSDIINASNEANASAHQAQLDALNEQLTQHQNASTELSDQVATLDAQQGVIQASGAVEVLSAQQRLADLQTQLSVYDQQIEDLNSQNALIDLQTSYVQTQSQIKADTYSAELISLNAQLAVYDQQQAKIQQQNDSVTAQSTLIQANNAVAAAGYNQQLLIMQSVLDARQVEITKLNDQKDVINAQTGEINNQNAIAAAGHEAQLVQLNAQIASMSDLSNDLNAQLGTLNAQKKVYEDIRTLADQIANRPANPPAGPPGVTPGTPTSGPPGTVVATATMSGQPTLYLSRGTGTDGWYTSDGRLAIGGGNAPAPKGYKVKYLASGGDWPRGTLAVVGEDGPELAIAKQDLVVFPHEQSSSMMRGGSGHAIGADGMVSGGKNVTVNVEYHRHSGKDYGEASLPMIVRQAVNIALRQ
jgi:tape measure domain-containing protein